VDFLGNSQYVIEALGRDQSVTDFVGTWGALLGIAWLAIIIMTGDAADRPSITEEVRAMEDVRHATGHTLRRLRDLYRAYENHLQAPLPKDITFAREEFEISIEGLVFAGLKAIPAERLANYEHIIEKLDRDLQFEEGASGLGHVVSGALRMFREQSVQPKD